MPTTYTRTQVRQEVLKRWPEIGWAATADSVSTTAIVDVSEFAHSGYQTNEFKDYWINRYSISANDDRKRVGEAALNQTTGTLTQDSVVYSDTTSLTYELLGCDPRDLNGAIATAQRKRYFRTHILLSRSQDTAGNAADLDMETAGVAMWDGSTAGSTSNATVTKVTTVGNVFSGTQALSVALSATNGYARSAAFRVNPSRVVYTGLYARADVGTLTFKLYDVTNGAYISTGSDVSYSGEEFAYLERIDTLPAGCEEVLIELRGTGSSDVLYVDSITGPWNQGTRRIFLPSWLNETYKLRFVRPARHQVSLTSTSTGLVWDAHSRYFFGDLEQPQDFWLETFDRDVNGYALNLNEDMPQNHALWLSIERSRAVLEPLTSESSTTTETVDGFEQLMSYVMYEVACIFSGLSKEGPQKEKWEARKKEYALKEAIETLARPAPAQVPTRALRNMRI